MNKKAIPALLILAGWMIITSGCAGVHGNSKTHGEQERIKLYWFIPDGMRAEPDLFNIYRWAEEGRLPNIRKMMEQGSYGFAMPVFPSHTPVNFATLLTGQTPKKHLVAAGPMHVEGRPLSRVAVGGFSSAARKTEPIWVTLEKSGRTVSLLSLPGSTPPELEQGSTIRGRWGGWGADFHAVIFEEAANNSRRPVHGREAKLFTQGPALTEYVFSRPVDARWVDAPRSYSPPREAELSHYGATVYAYLYDSTDDGKVNLDRILFSSGRKNGIADIGAGAWSGWNAIDLSWKFGNEERNIPTRFRIKVIKLRDDGFFRVRFLYDNLNEYVTLPPSLASSLRTAVGPMVDFVDNFPPQLIAYPEDKAAFLEEMHLSFDWHTAAVSHLVKDVRPDVLIHDIYSPNQMLTSRWWMGALDPASSTYDAVGDAERAALWNEVSGMYRRLDSMLGVLLDNADDRTVVVLSSDHGACALNRAVRLNNLFAQKGWLAFTLNKETGDPVIDWEKTKVIYLKMDNIYVSPSGLAGNWHRASGEAYEKLRGEVITALRELADPDTGIRPVESVVKWEDVETALDLPRERVGDLTIVNKVGYGWNEEMTEGKEVFSAPLVSGYKQAIDPREKCLWTPFMIVGPGVKKNHRIETVIGVQDQYPTILHLLGVRPGTDIDGRVVKEVLRE